MSDTPLRIERSNCERPFALRTRARLSPNCRFVSGRPVNDAALSMLTSDFGSDEFCPIAPHERFLVQRGALRSAVQATR
jgi:hypothetical protein